jgi:hypothetical protein
MSAAHPKIETGDTPSMQSQAHTLRIPALSHVLTLTDRGRAKDNDLALHVVRGSHIKKGWPAGLMGLADALVFGV